MKLITQGLREIKNFPGSKIIFILSIGTNICKILKDRTILTMEFIRPITIIVNGKKIKVHHYYELPFYLYDYNIITKHIEKNSLLLDIGAHFGEISYRFLKKKKGYSYLFEPNPNNIEVIKELFKKNNIKTYTLFETALGSKHEESNLSINNAVSYEGTISNEKKNSVVIQIMRLDDITLKKTNQYKNIFIKIDVEGFEVDAIKGMIKTLETFHQKKKKVKMIIEIKNNKNYRTITKILKQCFKEITIKKISEEDYLIENSYLTT